LNYFYEAKRNFFEFGEYKKKYILRRIIYSLDYSQKSSKNKLLANNSKSVNIIFEFVRVYCRHRK